MQLDTAVKNLTNHGFSVRVFKTQQEAVSAISQELSGRTIGFGGSVTLQELGLFGSNLPPRRVKRLRPRRST